MPRPTPDHDTKAKELVQDALSAYLLVNLHDADGGDLAEGLTLERLYQVRRLQVETLVAQGLAALDAGDGAT